MEGVLFARSALLPATCSQFCCSTAKNIVFLAAQTPRGALQHVLQRNSLHLPFPSPLRMARRGFSTTTQPNPGGSVNDMEATQGGDEMKGHLDIRTSASPTADYQADGVDGTAGGEGGLTLSQVVSGSSPLTASFAECFWRLLEDRRVCYRDGVALKKLLPARAALSETLRRDAFAEGIARCQSHAPPEQQSPLNPPSLPRAGDNDAVSSAVKVSSVLALVRDLESQVVAEITRENMRAPRGTHEEGDHVSEGSTTTSAEVRRRLAFLHQHILLSDLLQSAEDLTLVVRHVLRGSTPAEDLHFGTSATPTVLAWQPMVFTTILQALIPLTMAAPTTTTTTGVAVGERKTGEASTTVFGEQRQLERERLGELCGVYMGQALKAFHAHYCGRSTAEEREEMDSVWGAFFVDACAAQMAPKLVDLWWNKMIEFYGTSAEEAEGGDTVARTDGSPSVLSGLPYEAVYGLLSTTADNMDIERTMQLFHEADKRGLRMFAPEGRDGERGCSRKAFTVTPTSDGWRYTRVYHTPGFLTRRSEDVFVQEVQLRLLAKLMASAKSTKADGGLRELVVKDIQRLTDPDVLMTAPWEVVNDVLSGLSVPSAMHLVKARSASAIFDVTAEAPPEEGEEDHSARRKRGAWKASSSILETNGRDESDDRSVPFFIWASLLRRCARDHQLDEAEALFSFIRQRFSLLTVVERHELVSIMMRMYATLVPPDAASALHLFLQHVLRPAAAHPDRADLITPDDELYSLLVKSADSRNASMMYFLEACAAGVPMSPDIFEALMGGPSHASVRALNRKLPQEYTSSKLDSLLRIPSNMDAHLRREEAQAARGRPIVDSTGDAI